MLHSKGIALFLSVVVLAGCSLEKSSKSLNDLPKSGARTQGNATFFIEKSEGKIIQTENYPNLSIPVSKTVSFKACLKDSQYSKSIINHSFTVTGDEQNFELISDANGCIRWNETFKYNSLANAELLTVRRVITGKKIHRGDRILEWIFNPWENFVQSAVDFQKPEQKLAPAEELGTKLIKNDSQTPLVINDFKVTIQKGLADVGVLLKIQAQVEPKIGVVNAAGDQNFIALTRGQFQAELFLINVYNENGQQKYILKAKSGAISINKFENGVIQIRTELPLVDFRSPGQAAIGLRLTPVNAPAGLQKFEGVFAVSEIENIFGGFLARPLPEISLVTVEKAPIEAEKKETQLASFMIQQIQIVPGEWNVNGDLRKRLFTVTAKVIQGLDKKPVIGHKFMITKVNGEVVPRVTNYDGDLIWSDSIDAPFLEHECFKEKNIHFVNEDLKISDVRPVDINPWNDTEFGYDLKYIQPLYKCSAAKDKNTRITMQRYNLNIEDKYQYDVNAGLQMILIKKANLNFSNVQLTKGSANSSSGVENIQLPTGKFIVKCAIVASDVNDFSDPSKWSNKVYEYFEQEIDHKNSDPFSIPVLIKIRDPKVLGLTSKLIVQVLPKESDENFKASVYSAAVILAQRDQGRDLREISEANPRLMDEIKSIHAQNIVRADQENLATSKKERFAKDQDLKIFNLNEGGKLPFAKGLVENWLQTGKINGELAWQICSHWVRERWLPSGILATWNHQDDLLTHKCTQFVKLNPSSFFDIEFHYILEGSRVENQDDVRSQRSGITVNQSYQVQKGYGENTTASSTVDISLGGTIKDILSAIPVLKFVSASSGARYQVSKSKTWSDFTSNSLSSTEAISLSRNTTYLPITSDHYEKCVAIKPNPTIFESVHMNGMLNLTMDLKSKIVEAYGGYFICEGLTRPAPAQILEAFFTLNQVSPGEELTSDPYADNGRPYFTSLRGSHDYVRFLSFVYRGMKIPGDVKAEIQKFYLFDDPQSDLFKRGFPAYPGHLIRDQ